MTTKKQLLSLLLLLIFLCSCKDENKIEEYVGINTIYLETVKDPTLTLGENGAIAVTLKSVQRAIRDTRFNFTILPLEEADGNWAKIKETEIVLKKGEREVTFHIVANDAATPTKELSQFDLTIEQMPDKRMELKSPLRFGLLNVTVPTLTENQLKLIEGYKAKGIDLSPFLGKVKVKTTVNIPAGGLIKDFENPAEKTYEGFSIITLSDKSTAEQPILNMTHNAMGMSEFFYFAVRKETIENYEFWYGEYAGPLFKEIRELINWTDKSVEEFKVTLDTIKIAEKNGDKFSIKYLGKGKDNYDDEINVIPFGFEYTAWDRQKKLIDKGNLKAIECHEQGASAMPNRYINLSSITVDSYDEKKPMSPPVGEWSISEKKMRFHFLTSVSDAGWYITVKTEYEGN